MRRKSVLNRWMKGLALVILVAMGAMWIADHIDQWRFPWAYASSGKPTLTGTWVGPLVTNSGQRLAILVEMELAPLGSGRRRAEMIRTKRRSHWLNGRVLVCASPGRVQRFEAWGEPEDTGTASHFFLAIHPRANSVPLDGLSPNHLRGQWGGKDSIALLLELYLRQGKSAIYGSSYPDTVGKTPAMLVRGTEADFNALCSRLPA